MDFDAFVQMKINFLLIVLSIVSDMKWSLSFKSETCFWSGSPKHAKLRHKVEFLIILDLVRYEEKQGGGYTLDQTQLWGAGVCKHEDSW